MKKGLKFVKEQFFQEILSPGPFTFSAHYSQASSGVGGGGKIAFGVDEMVCREVFKVTENFWERRGRI